MIEKMAYPIFKTMQNFSKETNFFSEAPAKGCFFSLKVISLYYNVMDKLKKHAIIYIVDLFQRIM